MTTIIIQKNIYRIGISVMVVGKVIIQSILSYSNIERGREIFNIFCGSVEILIKTNNHSWGLQLFMLLPPPLVHPPIAITPDKVEIYPKRRGGQGNAPFGLLPPPGREGVILQAAAENKRIEKRGFQQSQFRH
jgi:hypothetical protein